MLLITSEYVYEATIKFTVVQKYRNISVNPHSIGCLKLFFFHSKNAARHTIEIIKKKIQKF